MKIFKGKVEMYNEVIDVDTSSGKGVDRVLRKIEPLMHKMSSSIYMRGYAQEDIKQELAILAMEGIRSFDASKNVKLSTFLHIHLRNKIISRIKSENKISNNATTSIEFKFPTNCDCGSQIFLSEVKSSSEKRTCTECSKIFVKKLRNAKYEIPFCVMEENIDKEQDGNISFSDMVSADDSILRSSRPEIDSLEMIKSIKSIELDMEPKLVNLLYLISLEDYSIADAATKVGMSGWEANSKLKKLSKNKSIKDMLKG